MSCDKARDRRTMALAVTLRKGARLMTIHISEEAEARVTEEARRLGISVEALVEQLINEGIGDSGPSSSATGAALLEVLQASPFPEIDLTPRRERVPVRDVVI